MPKRTDKVPLHSEPPQKWLVAGMDSVSELSVRPNTYKPKQGGAKNTGQYTGIYTLHGENNSDQTMLIKQGDTVGETIAEYVGGNLYQLTIPSYSAPANLVRPAEQKENPSIHDVYVTSVFSSEGTPEDAFKAVGHTKRPTFSRLTDSIKNLFTANEESFIRKVILDDKTSANNTLGFSVANALWHGDHDVHMGNFVKIKNSENPSNNRYVKIDHGFSFFNFDKNVVNIFNPLAGKSFDISLKRAAQGKGKLIEYYPFNNFWDLASEKNSFYFSGSFIKGCDDIAHLDESQIRNNISNSLEKVKELYGEQSDMALKQFAERMGMNKTKYKSKSNEELIDAISNHMTNTLVERQKSIKKLSQHCRKQASKLKTGHHQISRIIDEHIIKLLDEKSSFENLGYKKSLNQEEMEKFRSLNQLDENIDFFKLISQANDLAHLSIGQNNNLVLQNEFYYYNSGQSQLITPAEFQSKLERHKNINPDNIQTHKLICATMGLRDENKRNVFVTSSNANVKSPIKPYINDEQLIKAREMLKKKSPKI